MTSIDGGSAKPETPRDDGPADPANSFSLIAAGARAMMRRPVEVAVLWAAGAALVFATQAVRPANPIALLYTGLSPAWLGFELANVIPGAVLGALALRLFLGGGRPWRAPDRGFWICTGLLIAADLVSFALSRLIAFEQPGYANPGGVALYGLILLAQLLIQAWLFTRLLLWPIGALAGEAAMTPRRSFSLMDGYVLGFVAAVILVNVPLTLATTGFTLLSGASRHPGLGQISPTTEALFALIGPPVHLLERAMAALLYRARTGDTLRH
ncbi:hypothetical protein [Phenylobacterium sp.]|uniref:hypothetical protein n=1 Tax=Phenylobacterium sp. TaxID=1871053 RepID=UPI0011FB1631|nr:hypothetical protein [Phenylobacterium sp.]THD50789.1 MAG: hypothetical protein E8A12_21895 [Phenylobacterium sp.]